MNIEVAVNVIDIILVLGLICGVMVVGVFNPAMYGCAEPHWSKKFLLGVALIIVSVAGLIK